MDRQGTLEKACEQCRGGLPEGCLATRRFCDECKRERARECQRRSYQEGKSKEYSWNYEKQPKGFLMRAYRNMQSRVEGIQCKNKKTNSWIGKELLEREVFYEWAQNDPHFWRLYKTWVAADYSRSLTPSVHRIDSSEGYVLSNMIWVTNGLNSGLSSVKQPIEREEVLERLEAICS